MEQSLRSYWKPLHLAIESACKKVHLTIDSPVVLATSAVCLLVHLITTLYPPALSACFAWLPWHATSLKSPFTIARLLTHSFGHGSWDHLQQNLMLFCLVGPPCERHYSSAAVLRVFVCTSVAIAISHWILGPRNAQVFGLSGVVFALIMLNGLAGFERQAVPASALLTAVLWIAKELWSLLFGGHDGVSHGSHLVGAVVGGYCGYAVSMSQQRQNISDWFTKFGLRRKTGEPEMSFQSASRTICSWLSGQKTK